MAKRSRILLCTLMACCIVFTILRLPEAVAADAEPTRLPVIMYHSVLKNTARSGKYIVTPTTVRNDLQYLKDRGYTTLFASELADLVNRCEPLPDKPVLITFDDGYLNNMTYVAEILEELDMKAVISVIGSYSEQYSLHPDHNPQYAHLNWEDICLLASSGRFEIANHSYDMHKQSPRHGAKRMRGESLEDYRSALMQDTFKLQLLLSEHCGIIPTTYTYPYGQISKEALPILQEMGFSVVLTCVERVNLLTDPDVLYHLGRFNREAGVSTEKFMKRLGICE